MKNPNKKTIKSVVQELQKDRQMSKHKKNLIRGLLLPMAGFLLFVIPYTTFIGPWLFLVGGYYLAKYRFKIDHYVKDIDTGESGETYDKEIESEQISKQWKKTDNNE